MTKDKIKILEVIQQGEIGGGESHLLTLINKLDRETFEPIVIALSNGEMMSRLDALGIKNYVVSTKLPFNISVWRKITNILTSEKIDLVHTHGARALSNLIYPASKLFLPVVHTVHGWSFHDYLPSWKRRLRIKGERFLTSKATINIAVSESNKKIAIEKFGAFNGEVINNGVDLAVYSDKNTMKIREEFKIPESSTVISFIARFIHDKNPLPLIKAFSRVSQKFPDAYLIMGGNGPARNEAIDLVKNLNLSRNVLFPGFRKDIPDILAATDIFCLPSIKEGLPISLIEAMAMECAVIATNVQGCVDVVTHEHDGLLVSIDHLEDDLTKALFQLLEDKLYRKMLATNARKTVERRFDAVDMTRKIEKLYLKLLKERI